jgi:hypothetical protein
LVPMQQLHSDMVIYSMMVSFIVAIVSLTIEKYYNL